MYDTVNFRLTKDDVRNVDFLEEIPRHIEHRGKHEYDDGNIYKTGNFGKFDVTVSRYQVKVKDGSLCKWYLGNNYKTMSLRDVRRAIEKISDELHLPFNKATVTRLDVGCNIITNYPPEVYFNHLGMFGHIRRLPQPNGLYYYPYCQTICFYDKNKKQNKDKETIPNLYIGKNVLRFEHRYMQRIAKQFKVEAVTGAMLYNERFYMDVIDRFAQTFESIEKVNDITFNFQHINGVKPLKTLGLISLVERIGGEINMINLIQEAQDRGELASKKAFDMRNAVKDACKENEGLVVKSDAITELEKKIKIALKYYR